MGGGEEVTGALSLKLLAWPHTGKMTKVSSCCDGRCGLIECIRLGLKHFVLILSATFM